VRFLVMVYKRQNVTILIKTEELTKNYAIAVKQLVQGTV